MWEFLGVIVQWLQGRTGRAEARLEAAVRALQTAALQTNLYEASFRAGKLRDTTREGELVGLWGSAAGSFFCVDPDLAERLQLKAEYWTEPDAWTPEQIHDARVSLQQITELTRQLLREGSS